MRYHYFLITIIFTCAFVDCNSQRLKATVSKTDSIISLFANIRRDHRIFGYLKPDTASKKMILLSVFTSDVEGNPFKCLYGAYYQTGNMKNMDIKFLGNKGAFIKASVIKNDTTAGLIYILRKWINFEK
jgi:hypothetical protein